MEIGGLIFALSICLYIIALRSVEIAPNISLVVAYIAGAMLVLLNYAN